MERDPSRSQPPAAACPRSGLQPAAVESGVGDTLLTAGQVEELAARIVPLARVVEWVRRFLAQAHPDLGRGGPVCPFVPHALELDTIYLTAVPAAGRDRAEIVATVARCRELFLELEPRCADQALNKALLLVFPRLDEVAAPALIDDVQRELKPRFVDCGLMIGEFHALNESPGLRNPEFRPLRSPVPMLAIRHMVESDLPFLRRELDPPAVRASFVRSYLRRLGTVVSGARFEAAVEALVEAEIELRRAAGITKVPVEA